MSDGTEAARPTEWETDAGANDKCVSPASKEAPEEGQAAAGSSPALLPTAGSSSSAAAAGPLTEAGAHRDAAEKEPSEGEEEEEEEEEGGEKDEDEGDEEEEGEEENYDYSPEDEETDGQPREGGQPPSRATRNPRQILIVDNQRYAATKFVPNKALRHALNKLEQNPKAVFSACSILKPHNVMECQGMHFTNRAVLVGDRFVRVNMFAENEGKLRLLNNPGQSLHMTICREPHSKEDGGVKACAQLHLLPNVLFVGVPGLRTAYFEAELHPNLGLTQLKDQPWETQCGSWCRSTFSHVVTTCRFVHYNRGSHHTEKPNPPQRPLALIPNQTPRRPPQEGDRLASARGGRGRGRGRGRGAGARGGGRGGRGGREGRGGRARGRGGRGHTTYVDPNTVELPAELRAFHAEAEPPALPEADDGVYEATPSSRAAIAPRPLRAGSTVVVKDDPIFGTIRLSNDRLVNTLVQLLAVAALLVAFLVGKRVIDASFASQS